MTMPGSGVSKCKCDVTMLLLLLFSALFLVISLIIFPAMFMQEINERPCGDEQWYFGWSYGLAWGAAIFMVGAVVLLVVDRNGEETLYREKTHYHDQATT